MWLTGEMVSEGILASSKKTGSATARSRRTVAERTKIGGFFADLLLIVRIHFSVDFFVPP